HTGAIVGGILIGLIETISTAFIPLAYKDAITLAVLLVVLIFKPSGLFTSRDFAAIGGLR
ncbi:MAG: hypothetical protein N2316_12405, partial [Spirochaetes bacterium]|nr:hypothetical protein [Spirochaetota bacterium]